MEQELLAKMDRAAGVGRCLYHEIQSLTDGKTLQTLDAAKRMAKRYLYEIQKDLVGVTDTCTENDDEKHESMLTSWITIYVLVHQAAVHAAPVIGSSRTTGGAVALPYRQQEMWTAAAFQKEVYEKAAVRFDPETLMQSIDTPSYLQKCLWWMQMELAACLGSREAVSCGL